MLVVFSASHSDIERTQRLLAWCAELGPYPIHRALIVCSYRLSKEQCQQLSELARGCGFKWLETIKQTTEEERPWPVCCNALFKVAIHYCKMLQPGGWLWIESDAIPLSRGWLDKLEAEYRSVGKPFMGAVYDKPFRHLNGSCIYPDFVARYNPYIQGAVHKPWDTIRPELTLRVAHNTSLMQRSLADPVNNIPHTFPDRESLSVIRPGTVLFHGCKDGTLIDRLQEQLLETVELVEPAYPKLPYFGPIRGLLTWPFRSRHKKKILRVRRRAAFGDAIAATCVARKLADMGYEVIFQALPVVQQVIRHSPDVSGVEDPGEWCDINLDGAYEHHPQRTTKPFWEIFVEAANEQLAGRIVLENALQCTPRLKIKGMDKMRADWTKSSPFPRPWIGICPRSSFNANRTVPDEIWARAISSIQGTVVWLGTTKGPANAHIQVQPRTMHGLLPVLSTLDLMVSVDTGPLHAAAALGIPVLGLLQASSPELHLTDQIDYDVLAPSGLGCLNCQQPTCPIDSARPPCQQFDPHLIADAVNARLRAYTSEDVSAVVTAYKPNPAILNRCLGQLLPQVNEIVVALPSDGEIPAGAMQHPRIRYLKARLPRIGYGRTANFGARHTTGRYILFINDDVFLEPGAVAELFSVIRTDARAGMVGHLLRYPDGTIQHGGTQRKRNDIGWGHIDHRRQKPTINNVCEVENVTHASVLMKRRAFYEAGCYDERFWMYWEDNAMCMQVRQVGWKILYSPFARGIHQEHQTSDNLPRPLMAQNARRSHKLFVDQWKFYFDKNPNCDGVTKLGRF